MKILFGAPSCVPATPFESSGAEITAADIQEMMKWPEVGFLSEVMNYPGVIFSDPSVMKKISIALGLKVPIDGHAPGLTGIDLEKYIAAGITTDHECFTLEEGREKIEGGMKILIREGSGAKNFDALIPLLGEYPEKIMFCSDDLHPDDLLRGHINLLVKRAVATGYDLFDTLRAASLNTIQHYNLSVGCLKVGDPADFIMVDDLNNFGIISTTINGELVYRNGSTEIAAVVSKKPNKFNINLIREEQLRIECKGNHIRVIEALDGELITREILVSPKISNGYVESDTDRDILKIVVINRYEEQKPAVAFIKGFKLKRGAIASSIGHDSHNIICVGVSDHKIAESVNWIIKNKGGIAVHNGQAVEGLPLDIAGIISSGSVENAAYMYHHLSLQVGKMGSDFSAPMMTLAFMALLVIPELKLSDLGLFDGKRFEFTSLFV